MKIGINISVNKWHSSMKKNIIFVLILFILCDSSISYSAEWKQTTISQYDTYLYVAESEPVLGDKRALMVFLKECYQSANAIKTRSGWKEAADVYGMIVAIPGINTQCFGFSPTPKYGTDVAHEKVLEVIAELQGNNDFDIDPNKVYVSGFGAGGSVAMEMACRYPDIIAGVGVASAQSIGADQNNSYLSPSITADEVAEYCLDLAGNKSDYFDTQLAVLISGRDGQQFDGSVYSSWTNISADALSIIYKTDFLSEKQEIPTKKQAIGEVAFDSNDNLRIGRVFVPEMGHAWSSGLGDGIGSYYDYIDGDSIPFPQILGGWFADSNLRVPKPPHISSISIQTPFNHCLEVNAEVLDPDGYLVNAQLYLARSTNQEISDDENGENNFPTEFGEPVLIDSINIENVHGDVFNYYFRSCDLPIHGDWEGNYYYNVTLKVKDNDDLKQTHDKIVPLYYGDNDNYAPSIIKPIETTGIDNNCFLITTEAMDPDGAISMAVVTIGDKTYQFSELPEENTKYLISGEICDFDKNIASGNIIVFDNQGASSDPYEGYFEIPEDIIVPYNYPPTIDDIQSFAGGDCIVIDGKASDRDGVIQKITISINGTHHNLHPETINTSQYDFSFEHCGLSNGEYDIAVIAVDNHGDSSDIVYDKVKILDSILENISPELVSMAINRISDSCLIISGVGTDADGAVRQVAISIGPDTYQVDDLVEAGQQFTFEQQICGFDTSQTTGTVILIDNQGLSSDANDGVFEIPQHPISNMEPTASFTAEFIKPDCISVSGTATDPDGEVVSVILNIDNDGEDVDLISSLLELTALNEHEKSFQHSICNVEPGGNLLYLIVADNLGAEITTDEILIEFGSSGSQNIPPVINDVTAEFNNDCIEAFGTASDSDGSVTSIIASINDDSKTLQPIMNENQEFEFSLKTCGFDAGDYTFSVVAIDNQGDSSSVKKIELIILAQKADFDKDGIPDDEDPDDDNDGYLDEDDYFPYDPERYLNPQKGVAGGDDNKDLPPASGGGGFPSGLLLICLSYIALLRRLKV